MILELITQFVIGFITLSVIIGLGIVIYSICKKIYDDCGGISFSRFYYYHSNINNNR